MQHLPTSALFDRPIHGVHPSPCCFQSIEYRLQILATTALSSCKTASRVTPSLNASSHISRVSAVYQNKCAMLSIHFQMPPHGDAINDSCLSALSQLQFAVYINPVCSFLLSWDFSIRVRRMCVMRTFSAYPVSSTQLYSYRFALLSARQGNTFHHLFRHHPNHQVEMEAPCH